MEFIIRNKNLFFALAFFLNAFSVVCFASTSDPVTKEDQAFVLSLKEVVKLNQIAHIADYVYFPLRVNFKKHVQYIKTKKEFIARYNEIFTDRVKATIREQSVDPEKLFKDSKGIMLGNGEIWIDGITTETQEPYHFKLYIIAINP